MEIWKILHFCILYIDALNKPFVKKMKRRFVGSISCVLVYMIVSCDDDRHSEVRFLEGQEIPNTVIFDSLGCCGIAFRNPAISPDGQWVAYVLFDTIPEARGLYKMNLLTYEKKLLINTSDAAVPDWSSDGEWIVFNIVPQIYKIKANGDSLTQLTSDSRNFSPAWNSNGSKIAYSKSISDNFGPSGTWVMNGDGSNKSWIGRGVEPDWHPKDNQIINWYAPSIWHIFFVYDLDYGTVDSVDAIRDQPNQSPQYSPDGSRILFWNDEGTWIMNSDGTNPKRILPFGLRNEDNELVLAASQASWHPDGQHIIYEHYRVTRFVPCGSNCTDGDLTEGYFSFYLLNVDSALAVSNL